jgi:hypothetical protein
MPSAAQAQLEFRMARAFRAVLYAYRAAADIDNQGLAEDLSSMLHVLASAQEELLKHPKANTRVKLLLRQIENK